MVNSEIKQAEVEILLATYEGENYITPLLESLIHQTYSNLRILIRDDGSKDSTTSILKKFTRLYPEKITLIEDGKSLGVKGNFAELLSQSSANYVLFSDQDDYWLPHKVELTIDQLKKMEESYGVDSPLLVHTNLNVVDNRLNSIHNSFWDFAKINPNFFQLNRLLVQNCVTGCTMALNRALINLSYPIPQDALMHDWWIALLATSFGQINYIEQPTILYRQHQSNTLGAVKPNLWLTFKKLISGKSAACPTRKQALVFLDLFKDQLNPTDKQMIQTFCDLQQMSFFNQRKQILKYRFFKHLKFRNFLNFFLPIRY